MKTITIQINGKDTEITLTKEQLAQIESQNPMTEVYKYHNTTEEEFDNIYKDIPKHVKAYQKECMIVAYYNKGWIPDFSNEDSKWYIWFYLDNFRLNAVTRTYDYSDCSARLCFKSKQDALDAVSKFESVFKESRLWN